MQNRILKNKEFEFGKAIKENKKLFYITKKKMGLNIEESIEKLRMFLNVDEKIISQAPKKEIGIDSNFI